MADIEHELTKEELDAITEAAISDVRREKSELKSKLRRECVQAIYASATALANQKQSKRKTALSK